MLVQQLYTQCLAQGAYFIMSEGEAAIIDPLRETQPYLNLLRENNATLRYIFETHFHADFVSGHIDLANKTGAQIVYGPGAQTSYKSYVAKDEEIFMLGKLRIKVLHTPGHTLESSSFLLLDDRQKPHCLFTGDTLFIGDVGRPDLAIKSDLSQEDLAGMLYDSLRLKIMPLPDDVLVYPAHGAGSACGKNMSKETFDTLGNQKKTNYALADLSKADFIQELTAGILPAPQYFAKNAALNKNGYHAYDDVLQKGSKALSVSEVEEEQKKGALILDVRTTEAFATGHIPGSWFIGLDGQFAPWVGALIHDLKRKLILLTPEGKEAEAVMRLARVGYDNCLGHLAGGMLSWEQAGKKIESVRSVSATDFSSLYPAHKSDLLDVRKPGEYEAGHLAGAQNKALDFIENWQNNLDKNKDYYLHCAGGYRSMIAISILQAKGYMRLHNISGGYGAITKTDLPKENYVITCTKT